MPALQDLLSFAFVVILLSIAPGPGMLYITAQTFGRGRKAGWYSAIGTHLASYIHIFSATLGLSLVLQAAPFAFILLKVAGAACLFWFGLRFLLGEMRVEDPARNSGPGSHIRALRESFLVELTNPKSALFFIAFLPQFTDRAADFPVWLQITVLGVIANVIFSAVELSCVVFADLVATFVKGSRAAAQWMRRMAGATLIGLGANLLISER